MNRSKLLKYRKKLGVRGETAAEKLYRTLGYRIFERNWRCKAGELDLVASDGEKFVFAEVKSLRHRQGARPELNLSSHQRRRNFRAARIYQKSSYVRGIPGSFDLVTVIFRGPFLISIRRFKDYMPELPPLEDA